MTSLPANPSAATLRAAVAGLEEATTPAAALAAATAIASTAGTNIAVGNSTGTSTIVGTACKVGQSGGTVGFYGATGAAKPSAYTQTYSTAARTVPAATSSSVATTAAGLTLFGFAEAQANAIPVAINAIAADLLALKQVVNALIDDTQALGLSA